MKENELIIVGGRLGKQNRSRAAWEQRGERDGRGRDGTDKSIFSPWLIMRVAIFREPRSFWGEPTNTDGLASLPRVAAPLPLTLRLIVLSSFLSPLHLLPAVHLRLMILSSDCGNYPCPAAVEHYAQQTRKGVEGGPRPDCYPPASWCTLGERSLWSRVKGRRWWLARAVGICNRRRATDASRRRRGGHLVVCLSVSADANEGLLPSQFLKSRLPCWCKSGWRGLQPLWRTPKKSIPKKEVGKFCYDLPFQVWILLIHVVKLRFKASPKKKGESNFCKSPWKVP